MTPPLISICCITYNRRHFIECLISSVLRQLTDECEFIILDDGSTDGTREVCLDERIRYYWQENRGRPFARNKCVALARGEFIIWIDSDDKLAPKIITFYIDMVRKGTSCDLVPGPIVVTDAEMKPVELRPVTELIDNPDLFLPAMIYKNHISNGGTLIRRNLFYEFGGYDEEFTVCQDYEWFSRIAGEVKVCHTKTVTQLWRVHNEGRAADIDLSPYEAEVAARIIKRAGLRRSCPDAGWDSLPEKVARGVACLKLGMRFLELSDRLRSVLLFTHAIKLGKSTKLEKNAQELLAHALQLGNNQVPFAHPTNPLSS